MSNGIDLKKEIDLALHQYADDVQEKMINVINKESQKTVTRLKKTSPQGTGVKAGEYAKGWRKTKPEKVNRIGGVKVVIYNTVYSLTHLLEKGHALRQGGRSPAIPHIAPAQEEFDRNVMSVLEKELKK